MIELSREQERFLALHARFVVRTWQWIFRGGTLEANAGNTFATITALGFSRLVNAGLVEFTKAGTNFGVRITDEGRRVVASFELCAGAA